MGEKGNVAATATDIPVSSANRALGGQLTPKGQGIGAAFGNSASGTGLAAQAAAGGGPLVDLADPAGDFAMGVSTEATAEKLVNERRSHRAGTVDAPDAGAGGAWRSF
jgi:hypothetical protein